MDPASHARPASAAGGERPHARVLLHAWPDAAALAAGRLGVYGGSFDPPHRCHARIARAAAEAFALEHVLFVPAARPPHKEGRALAPDAERVALLELLLAGEPRCSVWTDELLRAGPSYTLDTLRRLARVRGGRGELFLVLGSDNLPGLPRWRGAEEVLALARPIVAPRAGPPLAPGALDALSAAARARLAEGRLALEPCGASSSELRARLARGQDPGPDLPEPLARRARERGLYGAR